MDAITKVFGSKTLEYLAVLMQNVKSLANGRESTVSLAKKASDEIDFVRVFMKTEFSKHHKSRVDQSISEVKQNHCHH